MLGWFQSFFRVYGYPSIITALIHISAILSLIFLDWIYFVYGMVFYMIKIPLAQLIMHEYVAHETIEPRNSVIDLVMLLLLYTDAMTVRNRRSYHATHHVFYQDPEKDPTQQKMRSAGGFWKYITNCHRPVSQTLLPVQSNVMQSSTWARVLEPHAFKILWAYRILLFVVLPIEWFVVVVVYWSWLVLLLWTMHDWYFHGSGKGKDSSFWLLFWTNSSWHWYHHLHQEKLFFGNGLLRWFNLGWYYYLLFFRPKKPGDLELRAQY